MWDVWEALITPSIGFSGFVGAIILAAFTTVAKVKNNPFRFFISLEEAQYMSGWAKLVRTIYLSIVILLGSSSYSIYLTSIMDYEFKHAWLYKAALSLISPTSFLVTSVVFIVLIVLLSMKGIQKKVSEILYSPSSTKRRRSVFIIVIMLFILVYCLFFFLIYGFFINGILVLANTAKIEYSHSFLLFFKMGHLDHSVIMVIFPVTILYFLTILPIRRISRFLGRSEVIVNIVLKSGIRFDKMYLLNSNVDDGVLICDSLNMFDQNKYLIPKENIEYVRFETTYYSFDREVVPKYSPKLVMPYEFNDVEKELSKSIMRISVSKEKQ
ncbi:MAG: hypothetical protein K0Q87_4808 [Neobacillus sp.]|nr:hypothetical protein [Neobacillus sp.]